MKQGNEPDKPIKHIVEEGSRSHVVSWDSIGAHCSEPNCEINKPSDVDKQIDIFTVQCKWIDSYCRGHKDKGKPCPYTKSTECDLFEKADEYLTKCDLMNEFYSICRHSKEIEKSIRAGVVEEVRELLKGVGKEIVVFMKINSDGLRFTEKGREYRWTDIEQILNKVAK